MRLIHRFGKKLTIDAPYPPIWVSASIPKNSNVISFPDRSQSPSKTAVGSFAVSRASADKSGGRDWSADAHAEIIDFIPLSKPPLVASAPEMVTLYASGHSLERIAKKLGKAKSAVKSTLENHGIVLRPATGSKKYYRLRQNERRSSNPPFGFVLVQNRFVPHPGEIEVVREIHRLMKCGRGPRQIADRLNELGFATRRRKLWAHSVVTGILKRLKANQYPYNEVTL